MQAHDDNGNEVLVIASSGVYLSESSNQAEFSHLWATKIKEVWIQFSARRRWKIPLREVDHLVYKGGGHQDSVERGGQSGILTLATTPLELDKGDKEALESVIDGMDDEEDPDHCIRLTTALPDSQTKRI